MVSTSSADSASNPVNDGLDEPSKGGERRTVEVPSTARAPRPRPLPIPRPAVKGNAQVKVTRPEVPPRPAPKPVPKTPDDVPVSLEERNRAKVKQWGEYIYRDVNPLLVQGAANFAGVPPEWVDAKVAQVKTPDGKTLTFWEPTIKDRLTLTEKQSERLAGAFVQFASSPLGVAVQMWAKANAGLIAMGGALLVAGQYGWRVAQIKSEVAQVKQMLQENQNALAAEAMRQQQGQQTVPDNAAQAA